MKEFSGSPGKRSFLALPVSSILETLDVSTNLTPTQVFNNVQQFLSVPLPDHMEAPPNAPDDSSFFLPPSETTIIDPFSNSPSNPFFHPQAAGQEKEEEREGEEGQDIEDPFSLLTLPPDVQDRCAEQEINLNSHSIQS